MSAELNRSTCPTCNLRFFSEASSHKILASSLVTVIGFSIKTALYPTISLPDYANIAQKIYEKKEESVVVFDEELETVIEQILQSREGTSTEKTSGNKPLPQKKELTDDFVKKLGAFKDVADFKQQLRENIRLEKERKEKEQKRVLLGEQIIEKATLSLPRLFVESELEKMLAQFKADIDRMGVKFDDYLRQIKKTKEDLEKEWEKDAEKRAKLQLILNKIAEAESIKPDPKEVEKEVSHILSHAKNADPARARVYVETVLQNESVFRFFEAKENVKKE